jgi:hypothetical protein
MIRNPFIVTIAFAMLALVAAAQTARQLRTLTTRGYAREAPVVHSENRVLVDVEDLARITDGSLSFEGDHVVLTLAADKDPNRFSHAFTKAGIEAMASIREWGGTLMITVQNGYPVGNTMSGNTIMAYQGRAGDSVALASAEATTEADRRGLELLQNEFRNVQAWSDAFIKARASLNAATLTTSSTPLQENPEVHKMMECGQFLTQMFASGHFEDDSICH